MTEQFGNEQENNIQNDATSHCSYTHGKETDIFDISIGSFSVSSKGEPSFILVNLLKDYSPKILELVKQKDFKEWVTILEPYLKELLPIIVQHCKNKQSSQFVAKDYSTRNEED